MSLVRGESMRFGVVAFVVASLLCFGMAGASEADAAKPRVSASFGVAGSQVKVSGTVSRGAPRKAPPRKKWKAALEQQVGKKWVKRKTGKLRKGRKGSSKYKLAWKAPKSLKSAKFRVRVFAGKKTVSSSKVKKLTFITQVLAPKVNEVSASVVQKLPNQGDMTLVVSGNRSYKPGEYLAAAPGDGAPDGFLLKVVSSSSSGGSTTVQVKPGSLYDAVPNGQLSLSTGDLQAATPLNGDAKKLLRALDTSGGASNYANVPFSKPVTCSGSGSMTLDGNFDASLAPNFDLKWSKRFGIPTGIDSARATVDAYLSADASAELSAAASCTLTPITLLSPKFTFVVVVGPVPVPVTVSLPIVLEASASVSGSVTVSADASVQGSIGLDYRDGDVSAVKEFSSDANLNHEVEAQADAEALIGPDIEVEAGWKIPVLGGVAAEVEINARTGLRLEYIVGNSPPGKVCVPLELGGEVEFDTPIGDIEKALPEYSTDIKCVEFGGSEDIERALDTYRGWVAFQEVSFDFGGSGERQRMHWNGWSVDTSPTARNAIARIWAYQGMTSPPPSTCEGRGNMGLDVAGTGSDEDGTIGLAATAHSTSIFGNPATPNQTALGIYPDFDVPVTATGLRRDCVWNPGPPPFYTTPILGASLGYEFPGFPTIPAIPFATPLQIKVRNQQVWSGNGADYTYQVCLTRSTVDSDSDGLPDSVDLAPSVAASAGELGIPGGPTRDTFSPLSVGPSGTLGVPNCPPI